MNKVKAIKIVTSILLIIIGCKQQTEVNIPFYNKINNSNLVFKIDTIDEKRVYNILFSKSYFISMEEIRFGFSKEIAESPKIDYQLIKNTIAYSRRKEIYNNYKFFAIIKLKNSRFKKIPVKLSNITMTD